MVLCETVDSLQIELAKYLDKNLSIGFVPTMGALHEGHLSLIERSTKENDITVVSIFVNPTQFNNSKDLEKYPRDLQGDMLLMAQSNCQVLFAPKVEDMYRSGDTFTPIDLGHLGEVMEGKYRPGHFEGVVQIVEKLFRLVQPTRAYFGRKDFQQTAVIRFMTSFLKLPIEIIVCDTLRSDEGLALSSRNLLLSEEEKVDALVIYKSLAEAKTKTTQHKPLEVKAWLETQIENSTLKLEYVSIVDPDSLQELQEEWVPGATACVVAYCGVVRLIDNMQLI